MNEQKRTLWQILTALEMADQELQSSEVQMDLLQAAETKIDSFKYILTKLESRSKEIQNEIDELSEIKSSLQNKVKSIKALLLKVFKEKGIDKQPGLKYVASLVKKKNISITVEADSALALQYPKLITRSYKWDVNAFKKDLKRDPNLKKFAVEELSEQIRFTLKKGISDERGIFSANSDEDFSGS